jgi:hypothetical protein
MMTLREQMYQNTNGPEEIVYQVLSLLSKWSITIAPVELRVLYLMLIVDMLSRSSIVIVQNQDVIVVK